MSNKHTLGPWFIDGSVESLEDREASGMYYIVNQKGNIVAETMATQSAHLIASAPLMLQALEEAEWGVFSHGEKACPVCGWVKRAKKHKPDCILDLALKMARKAL